jgi:hypothetical protein
MATRAESSAERPRIFISYARSDSSALAEELVAGLEVAGFEPYLDRHDIAVAEDWEKRLGGLIYTADTILFILPGRRELQAVRLGSQTGRRA